MGLNRFILIFLFPLVISQHLCGQKTVIYLHEDGNYKSAIDLFQKQKYGSAQKLFQRTIQSHTEANSHVRVDAEYYSAICAIELFHKDGEILLKRFIESHPESPKVKTAYFFLGKYNYRKKKYDEAVEWFEKVDIYDLTNTELPEFYFKRGYGYLEQDKFEKAKNDFYEIKDVDTKYTGPANYYYAHIAYIEKSYETALQVFLKLSTNENFGPVVPYYIAQLYYLQGKYDSVISYAPPLLDSANTKRAPEIAKIIGEAYYRTLRFNEAIPFLKKYEKGVGGQLLKKDLYQLGYAYYRSNDFDNAIVYFKDVTWEDDSLTQNAYYHLADCYLKKNNKNYARNAFLNASTLNSDQVIKEDALFSYAKLCFELSYNPFSEAIKALQQYIEQYPNSPKTAEAYSYLVNAYLTSKNYSAALSSIEKIKQMNPELEAAYQRIAYFMGIDFFNNQQPDSAIKLFNKALIYKSEKPINSLCIYWKAEAFYRKQLYPEAIYNYKDFLIEPGAFNLPEYNHANYNLGYAYFQLKDYQNSNLWFRKYIGAKNNDNPKKLNDAFIRIGDGFFMTKDYTGAVQYYGEAIKLKVFDTDYALYQKAMCLGIEKKYDLKINDLTELLNNYSKSVYAAASHFELAKTYLQLNNNEQSLAYFSKVVNDYPNSSFVNKSLLQIALIQYNQKQDELAFSTFDKLVKKNSKSEEANEALGFIKKIFIAKNDLEGLEKYFNEASVNIPLASLDSVAYDIGKNRYVEGKATDASNDFSKYIQKFPEGIFINDATFYKAEIDYKKGNAEAALNGYNYILSKNKNIYTEQSLAKAGIINYKNQNYVSALSNYNILDSIAEYPKNIMDARIGKMRCYFLLKNYSAVIEASDKVLTTEKVSNEIINEAHLTIAKSALAMEQYDLALQQFDTTATKAKSEMGAEAKYNIAYIQFLKGEFKESEKTIFDLINSEPSYPLWMTKGLILLADNYVSMNDNFQAKHTLKTVIENSEIPELVKVAQEKLDLIIEKEKEKIPKLSTDEMKIEFKENKLEYNNLFAEPEIKEEPKNEQ